MLAGKLTHGGFALVTFEFLIWGPLCYFDLWSGNALSPRLADLACARDRMEWYGHTRGHADTLWFSIH